MIDLENITVRFQSRKNTVTAVDDVSLRIAKGEVFGIVGSSGAGKSTLVRTINLLERPTAGCVRIDGQEITALKGAPLRQVRHGIGMIFQHFNLIRTKTIAQNIAFPLRLAKKSKVEIQERVTELLELVGLSDKANAYPHQLSGGQKQRVGIARALANHPGILLCDEPTSALDLETTRSILDLLKSINQRFGITVVVITHEMDVVKSICDRVAVMEQGRLVELAQTYDIFANPRHPATQALVQQTLKLDLPEAIFQKPGGTLVKIQYRGDAAVEPVLSETVGLFDVYANILHGKIEYIGGKPIGAFVVSIFGEERKVAEAIAYIAGRTAQIELLGKSGTPTFSARVTVPEKEAHVA